MTESEKFYAAVFGVLLLLAAGGAGVVLMQTRGIRNNNPGNLRESPGDSTAWLGERTTNDDSAFEEFVSPEYGIRALALTLLNYSRLYGRNTVFALIERYAPPSENHTAVYAGYVAGRLGVAVDTVIDVNARLPELVAAIIRFENGVQPYPQATIAEGVRLARAA